MTSRERVVAAVTGEVPDKVPRDISWGFTPGALERFKSNTGRDDPLDYFKVDVRMLELLPSRHVPDYSRYHAPGIEYGEWGIGRERGSDASSHFTHIVSPLRNATTVEEIDDYPLPDLDAPYRHETLPRQVADLHAKGLAAAGVATVTIYEVGWQIRGFEHIMLDMMTEPDLVDCLFDRLMKIRIAQVEANVRAGCDLLMLGDDISGQNGMIISPEVWRRFLKGRMARIIDAARAITPDLPVFYHSDGNCSAVIDELLEIGVTVLNPVQPECMDPAAVRKKYGRKLALWGTIGTQSNLPFGSPSDVRREVKTRIETAGADGGLVLGPTHMIEPEVPWENVQALYEAIDEYGEYR